MSNGDNEGIIEEGIGKEITQDLTCPVISTPVLYLPQNNAFPQVSTS